MESRRYFNIIERFIGGDSGITRQQAETALNAIRYLYDLNDEQRAKRIIDQIPIPLRRQYKVAYSGEYAVRHGIGAGKHVGELLGIYCKYCNEALEDEHELNCPVGVQEETLGFHDEMNKLRNHLRGEQ